MDVRGTSKMSRFWKGAEQLFSLLQVGKTFEQLLEVMLELPPFKRHRLLTDATKLPPTPLPEGVLGLSNPPELFPDGTAGNVHVWHRQS